MTTNKNKRRTHFLIRKNKQDGSILKSRFTQMRSRASHTGWQIAATRTLKRLPYDPDLLFVECGRCGAPVIWEDGRAKELLRAVGIDPLELDPYCMLLTDGCPDCLPGCKYKVRMVRLGRNDAVLLPHGGNA